MKPMRKETANGEYLIWCKLLILSNTWSNIDWNVAGRNDEPKSFDANQKPIKQSR